METCVSLLRCIPSLSKLTLIGVKLQGELVENTLSRCLHLTQLHILGYDDNKNICKKEVSLNAMTVIQLLRVMPLLEKVTLGDVALTGPLTADLPPLTNSLKRVTISSNKRTTKMSAISVIILVRFLHLMPALVEITLDNIELTSEFDPGTSVVLSKMLKTVIITGSYLCGSKFDVMTLVKFFSLIPCLKEIGLIGFDLIGNIDFKSPALSNSINEIVIMAGGTGKLDVMTLVGFLSLIPCLKQLSLTGAEITGKANTYANTPTLSESLKVLKISGRSDRSTVDVMTLVWFLSLFPSIENFSLWDTVLTGDISGTTQTVSKSLKVINISCGSTKLQMGINTLTKFISLAPLLEVIRFDRIQFTGRLETSKPIISESLKTVDITGCEILSTNVSTLIGFLSLIPCLSQINLRDVELTGEFDADTPSIAGSLKEISIIGDYIGTRMEVTTFARFLSYMPMLEKVKAEYVYLTGEISDDAPTLSEFLTNVSISGDFEVDIMTIVRFLCLMPSLSRINLDEVALTGKLDANNVTLIESLEEITISGRQFEMLSINVMAFVTFISLMPSLAKVNLNAIDLNGEFEETIPILSNSLTEFDISCSNIFKHEYALNMTTLLRLLSVMPSLSKVSICGIVLKGELENDTPSLSKTLKEICVSGYYCGKKEYSVNTMSLVRFLSVIPSLSKVNLHDVNITGELSADAPFLSGLLKEVNVSGGQGVLKLDTKVLVSFFSRIPSLEKISLNAIALIGELDAATTPALSESLGEFNISCANKRVCSLDVGMLVRLLSLVPSMSKVNLLGVNLRGEVTHANVWKS